MEYIFFQVSNLYLMYIISVSGGLQYNNNWILVSPNADTVFIESTRNAIN